MSYKTMNRPGGQKPPQEQPGIPKHQVPWLIARAKAQLSVLEGLGLKKEAEKIRQAIEWLEKSEGD